MEVTEKSLFNSDKYLIVPNQFIEYKEIKVDDIINYTQNKFYWEYYKLRLKPSFIIKKIKYIMTHRNLAPDIYERPKTKDYLKA